MSTYTIKAGEQSSGIHFGLTFKSRLDFTASFDPSCLYDNSSWPDNNKKQIFKLCGLSNGLDHELNSARIGWRCLDQQNIQLVTYCHLNGPWIPESEIVLDTVIPGKVFKGYVEIQNYAYYLTVNDIRRKVDSPVKSNWIKYKLYPYLGDNQSIPHDMKINLDFN